MITEQQFASAAKAYDIPIACIKAVAEVESRGDGFIEGKPVILFEPHIFYQQLKTRKTFPKDYTLIAIVRDKKGKDTGLRKPYTNPLYADILYPKWKPGAYGKYSEQHGRLERAAAIDREAALMSASWGKFQIMGFNWELCGCKDLREFINKMYEGEGSQLQLFLEYLKKTGLDKALRLKDWRGFAYGYNGPSFEKNKYHIKLQAAFEKWNKS